MYSAQKIDMDGIPMEEVVVLEPLAFSVPDVSLDNRPMAGNMDWNPSEYVVPKENQTRRPMEGVTSPARLRHSVMQLHLDSQPSRNKLKPDQSGDPVPDDTPRRQVGFYGNQTVSDFLVDGSGDPVPKPAPSELAKHSTSVEHSLRQSWGQYRASRMRGDEQDLRRGKEGWFGREGQPPGPSVTVTRLTQVGSSSGLKTTER